MKKLKTFIVKANLVIMTYDKYKTLIRDEIMDNIINVVEKYKSYVGGGLALVEVDENETD